MIALEPAVLVFEDDAIRSTRYGDIYASADGGLEETRHVFHDSIGLTDRWANREHFTIVETGFGAGLNFLATAQRYLEDPDRPGYLDYVSVEKHPLRLEDLRRFHQSFPELRSLSAELIKYYPPLVSGFHKLWLRPGKISLTLCLLDIDEAMNELTTSADCWFLDGFAPSANPAMWSDTLFKAMARLGKPNCRVATYTAAGAVRRGLEAQGFAMRKQAGFGPKREMLAGELVRMPRVRERAPWFRPPPPVNADRRAIVVGAGIAGAQAAWHLAVRGWQVEVIERHVSPATEASGNPAAIVSPRVTAKPSIAEQFSVQAFQYQLSQFRLFGNTRCGWNSCGTLQLAVSEDKLRQWHALSERGLPTSLLECVDADQTSRLAGIPISAPSVHFENGGFLQPDRLISTLLAHERITLTLKCQIRSLEFHDAHWQALDEFGGTVATAPVAIIASGSNLNFVQISDLPGTPVLGQTSLAVSTAASTLIRKVVQHDTYITPEFEGHHLLGASYRRGESEAGIDPTTDLQTLSTIERHTPGIADALGTVTSGHSAVRMASENRMPYVGPVTDANALSERFPDLLKNQLGTDMQVPVAFPGLFISGAHGSRGFTNAALGGEIIAALANGETPPAQTRLLHALHPARYMVKSLRRKA